ncbi:hypothetical protein AAAC13_01090 [Pseudomonas aeruginosa]|nr:MULTISPECIES: hypothetical protein [Pseudomonas aeruginosa group]EIU1445503.1 hypothetical protein [Pseudomonas aeruginosa]EJH4818807.1 hypothetical protein [Pseudomonas aeruginosa]EKL8566442.1 hypothetical protein [Pseudomonas aeruginosa]EKS3059530.1 hypothetical protein [Pseudomonas aeruginosa]EKU4838769.1 hypothetical protein [Pseudomonas aeruginosa]
MNDSDLQDLSADASSYVRNCLEVEALKINPIWIPMTAASLFFMSYWLGGLTIVVMAYLLWSKRNGASAVEMLRRLRRTLVGKVQLPFRHW